MIIRRGGLKRYLPTQREGLDAQPGGILHLQEFFGGAVKHKQKRRRKTVGGFVLIIVIPVLSALQGLLPPRFTL